MDILKSADLGAVARTWEQFTKDLSFHAPNFYATLLKAHPEIRERFPALADVPDSELAYIPELKMMSFSVFNRLNDFVATVNDLDALAQKLNELGAEHKQRQVKRTDFDKVGNVLVEFLASALGDSFSDADREAWTAFMKGINTIIEGSL